MNFRKILDTLTTQRSTDNKLRFDTIKTSPYKFSNRGRYTKLV